MDRPIRVLPESVRRDWSGSNVPDEDQYGLIMFFPHHEYITSIVPFLSQHELRFVLPNKAEIMRTASLGLPY